MNIFLKSLQIQSQTFPYIYSFFYPTHHHTTHTKFITILKGLGALIAGYLYEQNGPIFLFQMCAFMSTCGGVVALITSLYLPHQPLNHEQDKQHRPVQLSLTEHSGHVDTSIDMGDDD